MDQASAAKRQKSNVGSALKKPQGPDYEQGIKYWDKVDASVDGVLGGFGEGVSFFFQPSRISLSTFGLFA